MSHCLEDPASEPGNPGGEGIPRVRGERSEERADPSS